MYSTKSIIQYFNCSNGLIETTAVFTCFEQASLFETCSWIQTPTKKLGHLVTSGKEEVRVPHTQDVDTAQMEGLYWTVLLILISEVKAFIWKIFSTFLEHSMVITNREHLCTKLIILYCIYKYCSANTNVNESTLEYQTKVSSQAYMVVTIKKCVY